MGRKWKELRLQGMLDLPPEAVIVSQIVHVRKVPTRDLCTSQQLAAVRPWTTSCYARTILGADPRWREGRR